MEGNNGSKMTPAKAVKILKQYGTEITEEQAVLVIEFLSQLAKIAVAQYLREDESEELPRIGGKDNQSERRA